MLRSGLVGDFIFLHPTLQGKAEHVSFVTQKTVFYICVQPNRSKSTCDVKIRVNVDNVSFFFRTFRLQEGCVLFFVPLVHCTLPRFVFRCFPGFSSSFVGKYFEGMPFPYVHVEISKLDVCEEENVAKYSSPDVSTAIIVTRLVSFVRTTLAACLLDNSCQHRTRVDQH